MLPYEQYMSEGQALRTQGRHAEAASRFNSATMEAPKFTKPWALAQYYLALSLASRDKLDDAIEAFEPAWRHFDNAEDDADTACSVGGNYGLALIRHRRWADAVRILDSTRRRHEAMGKDPGNLAIACHNLAIARTRSGDAAGGLEAATKAVELHSRAEGVDHPDTIESRLIRAYARIETGDLAAAGPEIRSAAGVILAQVGEAHAYFGDALLTEARRQVRLGDVGAGEALARRANYLFTEAGLSAASKSQRDRDALDLELLWRKASPARDAGDVAVWRMSIQHTLRRYQVGTLDFLPSGDRPRDWVFFVPKSWPLSNALYAARLVFSAANSWLNSREPSDPNFLDATQATASAPGLVELSSTDFVAVFKERGWEPTIAYSVVRGNMGIPIGSPADFARALAALGVTDAPLLPLGADASVLAAARADVAGTLKSVLMLE
ncbi:MAG TPA: tetratricopeptide repeat protein [Planctomycetota bacterium]|nr:tetratricopeptide repeat protein [Planctomycetota bacterium]